METPKDPKVDRVGQAGASGVTPSRRHWLTGAVAAGALAAGAGWAWWRHGLGEVSAETADAIWGQAFPALAGQPAVPMSSFKGKPLLLNFWATWCPPCVEELPMLDKFYQAQHQKGWAVLGLAVDKEEAVTRFLQRMPLTFPVAIAGMQGTALSRDLGNSAGGLPFTVVFDKRGRVQQRKMGQLLASDLQNWASL